MKEYEYDTGNGCLKYTIEPEGICISGWRGTGPAVRVPEKIDGQTVTGVGRKAFLSKKHLREIELPASLRSLGDWAFAYCDSLERVTLSAQCSQIGKTLFLDCERLDCISGVRHSEDGVMEAWSPSCGRLLAAAVTRLDAYYLLEPEAVGSREWLRKWDARLEAVMRADDGEGYSKQVLCGEEDYGSTDMEAFLRARRQKKVRLAMLRLECDQGLAPDMGQYLERYLLAHTKGCESEESWQVILAQGEAHPEQAQLFLRLGCAGRENIEAMIRQMREDQPQLRAAFLRYQQEELGHGDFFAGLSL